STLLAGNTGLVHRRGGVGERSDAQCPHCHPVAGAELEFFRQSPVEYDAFLRISGVGKAHSVTRFVKTFLVEGAAREIGPLPIAGHHVGPAHAYFELVARGAELELDPPDLHSAPAPTLHPHPSA